MEIFIIISVEMETMNNLNYRGKNMANDLENILSNFSK